jgi:hypothetical protein
VTPARPLLHLAAIAAVATGAGVTLGQRPQPASLGHTELQASVSATFRIGGVPVSGLYPGATRTMTVRMRNPYPFAVQVVSLRASVARATTLPACAGTPGNLVVSPGAGRRVTVPAHGGGSVAILVRMPRSVADACQGAGFRIALAARAVRA